MSKYFYISTPIYYPSDKPHIGHAYTTLLADSLSRYKKILGYKTFFVTGTDEHGQKIEQIAKKKNISPKKLVDANTKIFLNLWDKLNINYSTFIRTSSSKHELVVQKVFSFLMQNNLIYLGNWSGLYCVSCEENYNENDAINTDNFFYCKQGHQLINRNEKSYFWRISKFNDWIISFYEKNKNIIYPSNRYKELFNNFLKNNKLTDLAVSRVNFTWGVSVKEDPQHVVYVWIDALLSYISSLGYLQEDNENFLNYWNNKNAEIVHLLSKEITRFHCIYWPILLNNLNLNQPTKIISHGWIVTKEGKMSKSIGNVIDPNYLVDQYGVDGFRYCLLKNISLKEDSLFDEEKFILTFNSDLANNLGNLVNRIIGMINKYNKGSIDLAKFKVSEEPINLLLNDFKVNIILNIDNLEIPGIINTIINLAKFTNNYIETQKPWDLFKLNKNDQLNHFLIIIYHCLKLILFWIAPITPQISQQAMLFLGIEIKDLNINNIWEINFKNINVINDPSILFKRIEK